MVVWEYQVFNICPFKLDHKKFMVIQRLHLQPLYKNPYYPSLHPSNSDGTSAFQVYIIFYELAHNTPFFQFRRNNARDFFYGLWILNMRMR